MELHSLRVGRLDLYWLDGGGFRADGGAMFGPVPRPRWVGIYPPAEDNSIALTAHVLLVRAGTSWGLIDAGFGHHLGAEARRFYRLERETQLELGLAELGLNRGQIEWLVLTHLHLDHAAGATTLDENGVIRSAFANARIFVQATEMGESLDTSNRAHAVYGGESFAHLVAHGAVLALNGDGDVAPGVRAFLTGGHTRGHQGVLLGAEETRQALLHLGDLLVMRGHVAPTWVSALDDFPLDSIRVKREWLARVSERGWWLAFSHDVDFMAGKLDARGRLATVLSRFGDESPYRTGE